MYRKFAAILLAAGLADAVLTDLGLRLQIITEANPFMRLIYMHAYPLFYGMKLILPLALLLLLPKFTPRKYHITLIGAACIIYAGVMLLHARWIMLTLL